MPLKITAISLNLGEAEFKENNATEVYKTYIHSLFNNEDIISLHFQESPPRDPIHAAAKRTLKTEGYRIYTVANKSKVTVFKIQVAEPNFYQRLLVAVKPGSKLKFLENRTSCLGKALCKCCKGTVGMSFNYNKQKLIFMCSHLPVNPKQEDLGLEMRNTAFNLSIESVMEKLSRYDKDINVIWGGDLNYRILSNKDQLSNSFKSGLIGRGYPFREGTSLCKNNFGECISFKPTCKFLDESAIEDKKKYLDCRKGNSINHCYDKSRNPSYCDRILYFGPKLTNKEYNSFVYPISDHNGVIAKFKLN